MPDKRIFPEIDFVDTDTQKLVNDLIKSFELFTNRTLYPADPIRLFILWIADIIVQVRAIINQSAKQNVPRYAKADKLDSLAELFKDNVSRLGAQPASATFRFTLSTVLDTPILIPKGTRITVDGIIIFETISNLTINAGELTGDVIAQCQTVGIIGNGFVAGQITKLVDVFNYFERVENITESTGGAEQEDDDSFFERMRDSTLSYSTAGPAGAYIYHTKSVSPLIADVSAISNENGVVDIKVLLKDGALPSAELIEQVKIALSADNVRPLTDFVRVKAPETVNFDVKIKYFIDVGITIDFATLDINVKNAVGEYIKWQTEKMGRDINPSYLTALLMQTGVKRVEIESPVHTYITRSAVAVSNTIEIVNGGIEDE